METASTQVSVQVIIPARNEEDCIARCLESLVTQQGIGLQITVVDDGSCDRTAAIAASFPGVRVISAGEPPPGVSGKCNALFVGAEGAYAPWLLFTDADTFHYPGSLATALHEAEEYGVDLLSYSPEQEVRSLAERALMPVVFAELVRRYPPARVNDPEDSLAAANGQYILVRREVYRALGGHRRIANKLLEDVELARLFKSSHHKIRFRHGAGLVRTRMYRSFSAMWEGWTKNLASLFESPLYLAIRRMEDFLLIFAGLFAGFGLMFDSRRPIGWIVVGLGFLWYGVFLHRIRRAHFSWSCNLLAIFGLPLFVSLLLRSWLHSRIRGAVTWKGRQYSNSDAKAVSGSSATKESGLQP
jgi:glycosyltransferase involved in cell wall biosynthesis